MNRDNQVLSSIKIIDDGRILPQGLFSIFSFFVFLGLLLFVVKVGWSKVASQRRTILDLKERRSFLIEKKNNLEKANKDIVPLFFLLSSSLLPVRSQVLVSFSGIKGFLSEYLLPVDEFSISLASHEVGNSSDNSSFIGDSLRLTIVGGFEQLSLFLRRIEQVSPIMGLKSVSLSPEGDSFSAEVEISLFWSPYFYASAKGVLDPLPLLNESEEKVLEELSSLEKLGVEQDLTPAGPYERSNPFLMKE